VGGTQLTCLFHWGYSARVRAVCEATFCPFPGPSCPTTDPWSADSLGWGPGAEGPGDSPLRAAGRAPERRVRAVCEATPAPLRAPHGWLMTTTFFVLGLAVLTVAVGIRNVHQSSRSARVGFGLLVIGALFVCLAGVFRGFPLHDVAGAVGIPSLVMAVLLQSWSFRHATGWQVIHPATFLIAVGMFAAVVSMLIDVGMPGLQQRAFLSLLLLWLSIVVHSLVRVTAGLVQRPYRPTA
jgi:hypothetical membrane protein